MVHPYNDGATPMSTTNRSRKDEYGIFIIGLIAFLGLGYMLFNPIFLHSSNNTSPEIYFPASKLNAEKTAFNLLETTTTATSLEKDEQH